MKKHSGLLAFFVVGSLFILLVMAGPAISGAEFPTRPVILYSTFVGVTEVSARLLADSASKYLGQPIIVEPKTGGSGFLALNLVKNSKPDGYLLGILSGAQSSVTHMQGAPFNILTDLTPIVQYIDYRFGIIVKADAPYKNLNEFLDYGRKNPGKVTYSTGGWGAISHVCASKIFHKAGVTAKCIPYDGAPPALTAVMGGHADAASICFWEPYVKEGRLKALAVFLDERMPDFPDVPTARELGYGLAPGAYVGIAGPAGLPKEVLMKLEDAFTKGIQDPKFKESMRKIYMESHYRNSTDFKRHVEECHYELKKVVTEVGLVTKK